MARVKLTAGRIAALELPEDAVQYFLWDADTAQLAVRVTTGAKAYIFQSRLNGRSLRLTIGNISDWGIEDARREARRLQTLVDQGLDPREQKKEKRAENEARRTELARRDITVIEVWDAYIAARRYKWSDRHIADHKNITQAGDNERISGALAALMSLKLAEINTSRVKAWLRDETARRPTQAALAFRLLRAFINWCADTPNYAGIAGADACQKRMAKDTLPKKNAKSDCLQREQLPMWFDAVRSINNPVISAYLQTLLIIGARREELAGLKWDDVDFKWNTIIIRDKVDGLRTIPLTPYVSQLLTGLPRRNEWVFSSPMAKSGRLQEPSIQHRRVCAMVGIDGLTLHGLRRSFSTLTEWVECPVGVVAQIMGHKPSATAEKHYKVRPLDLLRMWHTKIEAWLIEQANIQFVPMVQGLKVVTA